MVDLDLAYTPATELARRIAARELSPVDVAQAPIEITHLGSGICSYRRRMTGAILLETRPAMIMRSDWRGEPRITSAPKREMS